MSAYWLGVATPVVTFLGVVLGWRFVRSFSTGWRYGYDCDACRALAYGPRIPNWIPKPLRWRLGVKLAERDHWHYWLEDVKGAQPGSFSERAADRHSPSEAPKWWRLPR